MIHQLDLTLQQIVCLKVDTLVCLLHLNQSRMRGAVGTDQTIRTEILLVYPSVATHISSIIEVFSSIGIGCFQALVYPVPDKTTLQIRRFQNNIPVFLEVTGTVTHSMRILTKNPRTVGVFTVGISL